MGDCLAQCRAEVPTTGYTDPSRESRSASLAQIETLYQEAEKAKEPETQVKLMEEVTTLLAAIRLADPAYALTLDTFEQMMPDRGGGPRSGASWYSGCG